jgi:hypothetical protein
VPYVAISKVRHWIDELQEARGISWFSEAEQKQYDELLTAEAAILADIRARGLPIPKSKAYPGRL